MLLAAGAAAGTAMSAMSKDGPGMPSLPDAKGERVKADTEAAQQAQALSAGRKRAMRSQSLLAGGVDSLMGGKTLLGQ